MERQQGQGWKERAWNVSRGWELARCERKFYHYRKLWRKRMSVWPGPWGGGGRRDYFSSDLSSAKRASLPVLISPLTSGSFCALFGSEQIFMLLGWALEGEWLVVEHTAGTWPCLPSAHHFLPEPAESVVFSQAITQEQREPDHSVDLFLVWRIFCKKSELYYYHEMGWWQYLYCSKCMGPRRCDLCPFQRLVDHQCFPTKETAEAAISFLILSSYQLHLEVKCMLCLLKQWGCVTHDKS